MFLEEKPYLEPLPFLPFRYFDQETRTVYDDGTIQVNNAYYGAAPAPLYSKVTVRIYDDLIEILDPVRMEVIRRHAKSDRPGSVLMRPEERIFNPSRETDRLLARAEMIGPHSFSLCEMWFNQEGRTGQRRWDSVRAVWLEDSKPDQEFLSYFIEDTSLADAYEQSVQEADKTVDILRAEADFVAVAQALGSQIAEHEKTQQIIQQQRDDLAIEKESTLEQWQGMWTPLGLSALSPVEMIEWSGRAGQIRRSAAEYHEKVSRQEQLENAIKKINADLMAAFDRLSLEVPDSISHAGLVDFARRTVKENDSFLKQRKELEVHLQNLGDQKDQILQQIEEIEESKRKWSEQWKTAMIPLKLHADTNPDEAMDYIEALDDVFHKLDDVKAAQQRIDAMNRSHKDFSEKVQASVVRLAPQLNDLEPERAAAELKDILTANMAHQQEYQLLETDQRKKIDQFSKEKEKMAGNQETLRQLCTEASTSDPEQLPEVERQSRHKSSVLKDAAAVKERLSELAAGQALQAFIENARQQDPDVLSAELEKSATEKADLTKEREGLVADIAVTRSELKQFDGQSQAAGFAVEADGIAGKIQSDVEHYAKVHLASVILAKAIERYRKHNESPVLEAASDYFRILTKESFTELKADFDDNGDPVLKAVRAEDNAALTIHALSDGARDQMFLALRLGGLSRHIESSGSIPFIVDDVLVHFDNERSSAALQSLASLAEKTQIIFFTHHRHLVDLAVKAVPEQLLCAHHL